MQKEEEREVFERASFFHRLLYLYPLCEENDAMPVLSRFSSNILHVPVQFYDAVSVSKLLILAIAELFEPSVNSISAMAKLF